MPNKTTKAERKHMDKVAQLGCIVCCNLGYDDTPAEIHHIGNGTMSKRASNYEVIPLCPFTTDLEGMVTQSIQVEKLGNRVTEEKKNCLNKSCR